MSLNYFIGAIALVGGVVGYFLTKKTPLTFDEYCEEYKSKANAEIGTIDGAVKTILVLAKCGKNNVAPYLYSNCADGKIKKIRIQYRTFPFYKCPNSVKESISKGEYVLCKF